MTRKRTKSTQPKPRKKRQKTADSRPAASLIPWTDIERKKLLASVVPLGSGKPEVVSSKLANSWVNVRTSKSTPNSLPTVRMFDQETIQKNLKLSDVVQKDSQKKEPKAVDTTTKPKKKSTKPRKTPVKKISKKQQQHDKNKFKVATTFQRKRKTAVTKKPKAPAYKSSDKNSVVICSFKMRLRPTAAQKLYFHRLFNLFDDAYNNCVFLYTKRNQPANAILMDRLVFPNPNSSVTKNTRPMRKFEKWKLSRLNPYFNENDTRFHCAHSDLRKEANREFCARVHSTREAMIALAKKKGRKIPKKFEMKPRDKHGKRRIFKIPRSASRTAVKISSKVDENGFASSSVMFWPSLVKEPIELWKRGKNGKNGKREVTRLIAMDERVPNVSDKSSFFLYEAPSTCTLLYDKGRYFLVIPIERRVPKPKLNAGDMAIVNSCDGGGRVFQTVFDGCGNYKEYGFSEKKSKKHTGVSVLIAHEKRKNKLQSKLDTLSGVSKSAKRNIRRKMKHIDHRIQDKQHDAHIRIAKEMCRDADQILFPPLDTKRMCRKFDENGKPRKLDKTTVKGLSQWAHGKFRVVLEHVGKMTGTGIHIVPEKYTTQGCGKCLRIHSRIGRKEHFVCPHEGCGYEKPRDQHSSRMICMSNVERIGDYCVPNSTNNL